MEPTGSGDDARELERSLSALVQLLRTVPHLPAEMARARREFFGADRPDYVRGEAAMTSALLRFGEWYALERESDVMGEVPLEGFLRRGAPEAEPPILHDSTAGVYLVEHVEGDRAQLRDLQDRARLELLVEPDGVRAQDLLAGRLYRRSDGALLPSPVLGIHAGGAELARAFERDVRRLRLQRRLNQAELEHLLFRGLAAAGTPEPAPPGQPLERLEARLQDLLARAGTAVDATRISAEMRQAPSAGTVIGPIMDRLAVETAVDLEQARRLLLEMWNHLGGDPGAGPAPEPVARVAPRPAESLGQILARRIEQGLAEHEDIEELFASVSEMLGDDPEADADQAADPDPGDGTDPRRSDLADAEPPPPGEAGDLEPLVREFLWETGQDDAPAAAVLQRLVALQREAPVPKLDLEYLDGFDLQRLLLLIYLQSPPAQRASAVRGAHGVLAEFYRWAERTQDYELRDVLDSCGGLVDDVGRVAELSIELSDQRPADGDPCLMRVTGLHEETATVLRLDREETVPVAVPARAVRNLRPGDLLLGALQAGGDQRATLAGMVVVVPGELEDLLG